MHLQPGLFTQFLCSLKTTSSTLNKPASDWEHAFSVGNGRLGTMIHGNDPMGGYN